MASRGSSRIFAAVSLAVLAFCTATKSLCVFPTYHQYSSFKYFPTHILITGRQDFIYPNSAISNEPQFNPKGWTERTFNLWKIVPAKKGEIAGNPAFDK